MNKVQMSILLAFLCFLLATFTHSAAVSEALRSRSKKQPADVTVAEIAAIIATNRKSSSQCAEVACADLDLNVSSRSKRQVADVKVAEYLAWIALQGKRPGCAEVACGSVDVEASSRSKRQSADVKVAEYLAWMALNGKRPSGCAEVACGIIDVLARVRRSSADQRIAELQALLALAGSRRRNGNNVAHGLFDPDTIGKKKRDFQPVNISEEERYNLLKYLIQKAALENSSS